MAHTSVVLLILVAQPLFVTGHRVESHHLLEVEAIEEEEETQKTAMHNFVDSGTKVEINATDTDQDEGAAADSTTANETQDEFELGEKVQCRDRWTAWMNGVVTSVEPLEVKPEGKVWKEGYKWKAVRKERKITFQPGSLGLSVDEASGVVLRIVDKSGQGAVAGVRSGWQIKLVDGEPFSFNELAKEKVTGDNSYVLTFMTGKDADAFAPAGGCGDTGRAYILQCSLAMPDKCDSYWTTKQRVPVLCEWSSPRTTCLDRPDHNYQNIGSYYSTPCPA